MRRTDLTELHYITPIANLGSIVKHGIRSHARAKKLKHTTIAMSENQRRRARIRVPGGKPLCHFANLFVCARNPFLYKRRAQNDDICVLRVSTDVLDITGTVVSDIDASSNYARFAAAPRGLAIVNRDLAFATDWRDQDRIQYYRKKAAKCAEVLVPDRVAPQYVKGAYVANTQAQQNLRASVSEFEVTIESELFF